jgi:hypothetical protein
MSDNKMPWSLLEKVPDKFFNLIPQESVKHLLFGPECQHNAVWDVAISPDGRVFFSLCAEGVSGQYVRLYEYFRETNTCKLHFRLEDKIIMHYKTIRPSKIHTSIQFMNDGRMIMVTHTTAQAPQHPAWLPWAYYNHQFEGYQGSNIIIYDPDTGAFENRGVPVPFESTYGGVYDSKYNAYYCAGMIKGRLYRYDIAANTVKDFGTICDGAVYKFGRGPDNHIYTTSRQGRLFKIDVDRQEVIDLGLQIQHMPNEEIPFRTQLNHCTWYKGVFYFNVAEHDNLFSYDPAKNELIDLGPSMGPGRIGGPVYNAGIAVDSTGTLWYGVTFRSSKTSCLGISCLGIYLYSMDIENHGSPVCHGLLGSRKRSIFCISEMDIRDDVLYISDTNHGFDPAGFFSVDLRELRRGADTPMSLDPANYIGVVGGRDLYPGDKSIYDSDLKRILKGSEEGQAAVKAQAEWWYFVKAEKNLYVRLWQHVGYDDSAVHELRFSGEDTLEGVCGGRRFYAFTILLPSGELSLKELPSYTPPSAGDYKNFDRLNLPFHPGRQFLARASCVVKWNGDRTLVGTEDGFLALVKEQDVFSLGPAASYGPVRTIVTDTAKTKAVGISGHSDGLGEVFCYDDRKGLRRLGFASVNHATGNCLSSCALSPSGANLAVGTMDKQGDVFFFPGFTN